MSGYEDYFEIGMLIAQADLKRCEMKTPQHHNSRCFLTPQLTGAVVGSTATRRPDVIAPDRKYHAYAKVILVAKQGKRILKVQEMFVQIDDLEVTEEVVYLNGRRCTEEQPL